jgi:hypothetical protein
MVDLSKRVPVRRPEPRAESSSKPITSPKTPAAKSADFEARKATKTEQQYDQDHNIFTK